ncbi:hypothetical protein [Kribbia dieselivorans]|uniref:hypothetical protein n=1 Tax=Kribbia dieselivorans TaxID=331526 RepID=UPI0008390C21|nr:hypothetical protein [Kribbia dieselivorans]
MIGLIGSIALAIGAVAVMFGMTPVSTVSGQTVTSVMADDLMNQSSADSALKQTVVNGWVARDLLEILATDAVEGRDERPALLLMLGVLGLCLHISTSSQSQLLVAVSSRGGAPEASDISSKENQ